MPARGPGRQQQQQTQHQQEQHPQQNGHSSRNSRNRAAADGVANGPNVQLDPDSNATATANVDGVADAPQDAALDERESKKYKHTYAVHSQARVSPLTSGNPKTPSFFGFRNLMGLVLVASNLRLMIENFRKYGLLVTLSGAQVTEGDWWWFAVLYLSTPAFLFLAYSIEAKAAGYAKDKVAERKKTDGKSPATGGQASKR
jgi:hypothetical protein